MIKVALDEGAYMPKRAHDTDAGWDIMSPKRVVVPPHGSAVVNTGVHIEVPKDCAGFLKSKSGLNVKNDLTGEGVVDVGYSGCVVVKLYNNGGKMHVFERGDKLIQIVFVRINTDVMGLVSLDAFEHGERGTDGFGSTGK